MYMELTNVELCIFDLDGTLVNSNAKEIPYFFSSLSAKLEHSINSNISHYPQRTFSSVINQAVPLQQRMPFFEALDGVMYEFVNGQTWSALEMGATLLNEARINGIKYYIVTGNYIEASLLKANKAGLMLERDKIYATTLEQDSKSQVIETLIAHHQCSADKVLSIGDSNYDEQVAHKLGIRFIKAY